MSVKTVVRGDDPALPLAAPPFRQCLLKHTLLKMRPCVKTGGRPNKAQPDTMSDGA